MPDTGFVLAGTGASEAYTGSDVAWSNPTRVTASDDSRATASLTSAGLESEYLKASGFDLSSVPGGATIDGVEVRVERSVGSGSGTVQDQHVHIRKGDGGALSNDKKQTGVNWSGTDEQVVYGGASDLWGLSIAQSDLAGLQVLVSGISVSAGKLARLDAIEIRIYYTATGGGGAARSFGLLAG
jgi:hypothetical protein